MTINDTSTEGTLLLEDGTASDSGTDNGSFVEDGASDRLASNSTGMIFGGDMILDGTQISSANGVINLGTYGGLANGVIRVSDAYNLQILQVLTDSFYVYFRKFSVLIWYRCEYGGFSR